MGGQTICIGNDTNKVLIFLTVWCGCSSPWTRLDCACLHWCVHIIFFFFHLANFILPGTLRWTHLLTLIALFSASQCRTNQDVACGGQRRFQQEPMWPTYPRHPGCCEAVGRPRRQNHSRKPVSVFLRMCGKIRVSPSQILTIKIAITIQVPNNAGLYSATLDPLHSITPSLRAKSVFPIRPTAFAKRSTDVVVLFFAILCSSMPICYALQLRNPTDRLQKKK